MSKKQPKVSEHSGKRAFLELFGLAVIGILSYTQRDLLYESLRAIGNSNLYYMLLAVGVFWLSLPLTALSYQQLTKKKIPILTVTLAQLAGSGPGRIIPGGFGRLGLAILHFRKIGISTQMGLVISLSNNIFGIFVNSLLMLVLLTRRSDLTASFRYGTGLATILLGVIVLALFFGLFELLIHTRNGAKPLRKLSKEWRSQISLLSSEPRRAVALTAIALVILTANILILLLCARATGVSLRVDDAVIALSIGVFVGGILPTPGGLGGVEAGTASALIALGHDATISTTIAVLFRMVTYWQPLIPGIISYLYLREKKLI